jgi:hypothetical protein
MSISSSGLARTVRVAASAATAFAVLITPLAPAFAQEASSSPETASSTPPIVQDQSGTSTSTDQTISQGDTASTTDQSTDSGSTASSTDQTTATTTDDGSTATSTDGTASSTDTTDTDSDTGSGNTGGGPFGLFRMFSLLSTPAPAATYYVDTANGLDTNDGTATTSSFKTLEKAVSVANDGDTIDMTGTEAIASTITVSKAVTIDGQNISTLNVSGTGYALLLTGGATIENFSINKTDSANQNVIGIQADDVTIASSTFTGTFVIGNSETTRALEVSGVQNVTISGNHITHFRQPAYINNATGTVSDNYVADTKGWVVVSESNITFTGNTWGTGADQNAIDIAIVADSHAANPTGIDNYAGTTAAMSAANNNARIDEQVTPAPTLNGENFNTVQDSTYTGISVGFDAKNFGTVSAVTVDMERADGSHVIKRGDQGLFDLLSDKTAATQATAPFVIKEGTYHQATDVDGNGNLYWQVSPAEAWSADTMPVSVTITVTDEHGPVSVTIPGPLSQGAPSWPAYSDLVAPDAPVITGFTQNGNALACGALTNSNASASINWTAPAGSLYQFAIVPDYPDNHGEYTYYPSGSATSAWIGDNFANSAQYHGEGVYSYTMTAQGANSHLWSAPSAPCTLVYDKTAPVVSVTPAAGSTLSGTTDFIITINDAHPATTTNSAVYVYLYNTADQHETFGKKVDLSSGTGTFTVDTTALADGTYTLDVGKLVDAAGNPTADQYHPNGIDSYFKGYVIDNTPPDTTKPTVAFTDPTPADGSYVNANFDVGYTASDDTALKSVNVSLYDTDPAHSNHWVATCYANGAETGTTDAGTCTVKLPAGLPDGAYYVQVGAQDQALNWSVNAKRTINVQRAVPAAPTGLFAQFQYDSAHLASGTTLNKTAEPGNNNLELEWTAPSGSVTGYHILTTYPDGTTNLGYQGPNTNAWLVPNGFGTQQGEYQFQVVAVNANGESVASDTFILSYDTHSPTAQFDTAPAAYANANFTVSGTASDNVALKSVLFDVRDPSDTTGNSYRAGCVAGTQATTWGTGSTTASTSCTINTANLISGHTYALRIHASDYAGYGGGSQQDFVFDDTAPAAPTLVSPADGATVSGASVTQTWSDSDSSVDHYAYESYNDAAATSLRFQGTYTTTSKTATNVGDTSYWWRVAAVDAAGNQSAWSPLWQLTIDNTSGVPDSSVPSGTFVITPSAMQGWATSTAVGAGADFVSDDTSPNGVGALQLTTTSDNDSVTHMTSPSFNMPLADIFSLSYQTNVTAVPDAQKAFGNATLRVMIDTTGDGVADDELMYEPYYNGFDGTTQTGWQTWGITPSNGKFWSNETKSYNGLGGVSAGSYPSNFTLDDVLHDYPNAHVVGLVLSMGTWNDSQTVEADDLEINGATAYSFEPDAAPAPQVRTFGAQLFGGSSGGVINTGTGSTGGEVLGASTYNFTRDLHLGMSGDDVTALQQFLIDNGYAIPAGATGYFGLQTQAALAKFQSDHGIAPAVGYFGPVTRALVNSGTIETTPVTQNNENVQQQIADLLAKLAALRAQLNASTTATTTP